MRAEEIFVQLSVGMVEVMRSLGVPHSLVEGWAVAYSQRVLNRLGEERDPRDAVADLMELLTAARDLTRLFDRAH